MNRITLAVLLLAISCGAFLAAEPPALINYQGVLRDASDSPLNGDHDMVFHFWSAEEGGDEILIDEHNVLNGYPVTISGGLFNVELGGGVVSDGSGPGSYTSLAEVFRDHGQVYLAIEVGGEVLSPRVRVLAAGYALNASHLDGVDSTQVIRSDTSDAFTSGSLTIGAGTTLDVDGTLQMDGLVTKTSTDLVTNLNADLLDGSDSSAFAAAIHGHAGSDITGPVAEATNADMVDGKNATDFIDTSSSAQAKSGPLTVDAGSTMTSTGVTGFGTDGGGYFADSDSSGHAYVGDGDHGIRAFGSTRGGYFGDVDSSGTAELASGDYGIRAFGNSAGGYFKDLEQSGYAYVGANNTGIQAYGNDWGGKFQDLNNSGYATVAVGDWGIDARGNMGGGYFRDSDSSGGAHVAYGDRGIQASGDYAGGVFIGDRGIDAQGDSAGGFFTDRDNSGYASVGYGDRGIEALGNEMGGYFGDADNSGYVHVGFGDWGVRAFGNTGGGYFEALAGSGAANVGYGNRGIEAFGNVLGGKFQDLDSSGIAHVAYGDRGIEAFGNEMGGYFEDADDHGYAYVGYATYGVRGYGSTAGGYFEDSDDSSFGYVGTGVYGVWAGGNSMGGFFEDRDHSGYAYVGVGDMGVKGYGNGAGGYFEDLNDSSHAYLAHGIRGISAYGWTGGYFESLGGTGSAYVAMSYSGIDARGDLYGGLFADTDDSGFAEIGYSTYKVSGNGGVSFVQNHPANDRQVVVYTAPEGDEVATYTRGTARLIDGEARVALGETFQWVTNPDIGLTAWVTPIGDWSDLYVAEKSTTELVVRSRAGAPDVEFDFIVYGLRIGFEEVSVVQGKRREAFIPSMRSHRERYARQPELRRYSAFERFKRMHAGVTGTDVESLDLSASLALRDAIHEYDPASDPPMHELFGHGHAPEAGRQSVSPAQRAGAVDSTAAPIQPDASAGVLIGELPSEATAPDAPADETLPENVFPVSEAVEPGDLLALDPKEPGHLRRADTIADPGVVGIVAAEPFERDGALVAPLHDSQFGFVKADASYGPILAGDLLTTSPTPGHAMVSVAPVLGTEVGKALEPLESGTGMVRVVVMLR